MEGDSDDFGLGNTGDFEIDGSSPARSQASAPGAGSGLFSGGDDSFGGHGSGPPSRGVHAQPAARSNFGSSGLFSGEDNADDFGLGEPDLAPRRAPPPPSRPPPRAGSSRRDSGSLFSAGADDDDYLGGDSGDLPPRRVPAPPRRPPSQAPSSNRHGSSGLFSGDDDDYGGDSADLAPRRAPAPPPRPAGPVPSNRRDSGALFSEDDGSGGLGMSGADDLGADIDHGDASPARQLPAADFTNPSVSLDANDSDIADFLGPQYQPSGPAGLPPRPGPALTVTAPPPPPSAPGSHGGYGLDEEDSELRELLGEEEAGGKASRHPPPGGSAAGSSSRRISFQEPVAAVRPPPPPPQRVSPQPKSESFGDSAESGYGLERDAGRDLAPPRPQAAARPATPSEDYGDSGGDYGQATIQARPAGPGGGQSFKRIPAHGSPGYDPILDPLDSPVGRDGRPPPRGIPPRRRVGESSEAYTTYGDDDEYDDDDFADEREGPGAEVFRRVPAPDQRGSPVRRPPAPIPPGGDDYDDDFQDDEDVFADDTSWDGEIRFASGGGGAGQGGRAAISGARPGSARQPRSRGPHATGGTRMRSTSALPPRERQAAMIEDMMSRHPSTWDIREVASWVEFIGLGQYRTKFVHNSVDGGLLLSLGEAELARDLRVLPLGHRRALMAAIEQLKQAAEAMERERGTEPQGAPRTEAERVAALRRRAAEQEVNRRPSSAGAYLIPPEPFLGPAMGKVTVYEQRAKLLYQLDRARHRAAQHTAIIDQLNNNKALTEAQMAELRGKLKDLEAKHKHEFSAAQRRGMTASVSPGGGTGSRKGAAALAAAEYGADAVVPWLPVGRGTNLTNSHPERFARIGEDQDLDLTFIPRVGRLEDVPAGAVRDIVAKALSSRTPFWTRMDFEFKKMQKEREAKEEARRKRRERMGVVKRGGEGEDEEQAKSKHWNNYWVPTSNRNVSSHKNFKKGSENEELHQYRSFIKDKVRLSRWFKRFVEDDEPTEGDVALERLINRMIRALVKSKAEVDAEVGDTFDKRIRNYFKDHGYKFETHTSNTIMVRARGTRPPGPAAPDTTTYDFEEVEQYYPDYLKKTAAGQGDAGGDDDGEETRMVPKRTTWKRLIAIYYMERQKKIRAAIAMVKMCQFVQRHGARWPPERDRDEGKKDVWVPTSTRGALNQLDGRDRTFNTVGQENISLHAKLLDPPQPVTDQMKREEQEKKAEEFLARMGWPHSSGDPELGPPGYPLVPPEIDQADGGGWQRWQLRLDFWGALDGLIDRALELRHLHEKWVSSWRLARERGYGEESLPVEPPRAEELHWSNNDPLLEMQDRAMEVEREKWLLDWEKRRRRREREAEKMRAEGYWEEEIEARLGPQQEAADVETAIRNHLFANIDMLSRVDQTGLLRFKTDLKGTKKKMAVYRALCNQIFLDETKAREERKEAKLRAVYDSLRPVSRRLVSLEEEEAHVARMEQDAAEREARLREKMGLKLAEEMSAHIPWYLLPKASSRAPSQPASRAGSPGREGSTRGRRNSRSPGAESSVDTPGRPRSASRTRGASAGGGGGRLEGEGSSRSKYVFGSSTPKSMWGPVGSVRQPLRTTASLLDSPSLNLLGGQSAASLDLQQQQQRTPRGRSTREGTPTRQRAATPTRSSGGGGGRGGGGAGGGAGGDGAPSSTVRSSAPPQRPRPAQPPPTSASRPSGGATPGRGPGPGPTGQRPAVTPPSPRRSGGAVSGGGAPGNGAARPAAPPSPRGRGAAPASPGRGRGRGQTAASPGGRGHARVGFATPPSPTRSSGGGGLANRPGAAGARRGLMDGDTSSGTPSPERRLARPGADPGQRVGATPDASQQQWTRGLADSDSSPSPQPRNRPPPQPGPPSPRAAAAGAASAAGSAAAGSRRSSGASGVMGPRVPMAAAAGAAAAAAAAAAATPISATASGGSDGPRPGTPRLGPLQRPTASHSIVAPLSPALSQQASASSGLGLPGTAGGPPSAGPSTAGSGTGAAPARVSGTGSARGRTSGTGSASGAAPRAPATGSAPGSQRPSTPPPAALQQDTSSTSMTSSTSTSRNSAAGRAGAGGSGSGATAGRTSGTGSTPQRSPLSRSPAAGSPQAASPQTASPPSQSPPSQSPPMASPRGGSAAPSPQGSQPRVTQMAVVEAEATEGTANLGGEEDYEVDEFALDTAEGEELDLGVSGAVGEEDEF